MDENWGYPHGLETSTWTTPNILRYGENSSMKKKQVSSYSTRYINEYTRNFMIFPGNHDVFQRGWTDLPRPFDGLTAGWWLSPTPLKNDGVKVNGKDDIPYMKWKKTCLKPPRKFSCTRLLNGFPWFSHIFSLVVEPPPLKQMLTSELASSWLLTTHPEPSISSHKNTKLS